MAFRDSIWMVRRCETHRVMQYHRIDRDGPDAEVCCGAAEVVAMCDGTEIVGALRDAAGN